MTVSQESDHLLIGESDLSVGQEDSLHLGFQRRTDSYEGPVLLGQGFYADLVTLRIIQIGIYLLFGTFQELLS